MSRRNIKFRKSSKHRLQPKLRLNADQQGFSVPLVVGLGLLMILISTTLIIKAQGDQVTAISQKETAESLALAEGGSSRTLGTLNSNYNGFLILNYDPNNLLTPNTGAPDQWSSPPNPPPCFDASQFSNLVLKGKIPASAATDTFTVEAYRYDPTTQTGTLLVKGYPPNSTALTRLQQTFTVSPNASSDPANFPGLYGEDINLANNDVLGAVGGNVFCKDCTIPNTATQCVNGQPTLDGLRGAIDVLTNGVVQGQIRLGAITLPTLPTAPAGAISLGDFDGNGVTFPRPGDTPTSTDSNGVPTYSYRLDSLSISGNNVMTLDTTNARIHFYVDGDITMSGSASILNTCTGTNAGCGSFGSSGGTNLGSPSRFLILGRPDNGGSYDQAFTLNGGATPSNLFIYAPDARLTINGGTSTPDIFGAAWVKRWDGSSSNNVEITVPNNMQALLDLEGFNTTNLISSYRTSPVTSWQRRTQ
jgi:hypothetical protein